MLIGLEFDVLCIVLHHLAGCNVLALLCCTAEISQLCFRPGRISKDLFIEVEDFSRWQVYKGRSYPFLFCLQSTYLQSAITSTLYYHGFPRHSLQDLVLHFPALKRPAFNAEKVPVPWVVLTVPLSTTKAAHFVVNDARVPFPCPGAWSFIVPLFQVLRQSC